MWNLTLIGLESGTSEQRLIGLIVKGRYMYVQYMCKEVGTGT